jgi:hypothetical protein
VVAKERVETPPVPPPPREKAPPAADPFVGQDVPEDMQAEIRAELTPGERIVWVERPAGTVDRAAAGFEMREEIQVDGGPVQRTVTVTHARGKRPAPDSNVGKIVLGVLLGLLGLVLVVVALYCGFAIQKHGWQIAIIPGVGGLIFLGAGAAVLIDLYLSRKSVPPRGACYVLTSRRALIHLGGVPGKPRFLSYHAPQLARMKPAEVDPDGAGSLTFDTGGPGLGGETRIGFLGVQNVRKVEKLLRKTLLDRPAPARARREAADPARSESVLVAAGLTPRERKKVLDELGQYEEVVWAARPDREMVVGRLRWVRIPIFSVAATLCISVLLAAGPPWASVGSLIGWAILALMTTAASFFPQYHGWMARRTFYVLTNRRAFVWRCRPNFTIQAVEYLGPEVCRMRREEVPEYGEKAGDLIFRSKVVITIRTGGGPGGGSSTDIYHYGFLSLRDAAGVERLVREHLIDPLVDAWPNG